MFRIFHKYRIKIACTSGCIMLTYQVGEEGHGVSKIALFLFLLCRLLLLLLLLSPPPPTPPSLLRHVARFSSFIKLCPNRKDIYSNFPTASSGSQGAGCPHVLPFPLNFLATFRLCCLARRCCYLQGKGFPDVATRLLVRLLWKSLGVPVLVLVDADPHGIEIMCVYRFGSLVSLSRTNFMCARL